MPDRSGLSWRRNWTSLQLAMAYALVAGVWIALSAGLIGRWLGAPTLWTGLAIANGLVFVLATASALSVLLDRGTARLIRRERYFRALTERALDVVAVFNRDGAIRFVSPAVRAALGYEPGELEGVAACDLVHPDDRPAVLALLERGAAVPNFTAATELRLRHKDGSWRTVAGTGSNLLHDPVLAGVVVNFRDVTESRRAEAQRDLLAAAVTQAAEAVLITDATGTIVYVNPAFERITGYVVADVLGANPRILKSGRQDASFYRRLWGTLLAGEAWAGRLVNRRKDGSLYEVEAVISPVRDAAGRIAQFVGIQRDVTHERRLEDQLRQAQKLEAVGQLTGGIAHDFNNILAVVLANTELVAAALPPELADLRADLDDVRAAARSGATMVRKLLGFSRRADLRLQPTNLADLVTDLSGLMRRVFPASIEIQLAVDPDLPDVVADPGAVQQILLNLLTNARDAMPNGGTVRIETAVRPDANVVCLAVRDSGEGMDARTKAKLFEPFFTTKPPGKGTGLGLSMVHGLVLQHGGSIDVESEPGCGTTVRICFPTCRERAAAAIPAPVDAVAGGTETILVVEDEEVLRRSAKRALERLGYTVLLAADGVEALDLFRANAQRIELVVADGVMPRMGGRDLYAALRREGSTVKFLLASGYALRESGAAASGVDPIPFLPKPWTLAELGRKVREVLDERARFEAPALTDL